MVYVALRYEQMQRSTVGKVSFCSQGSAVTRHEHGFYSDLARAVQIFWNKEKER